MEGKKQAQRIQTSLLNAAEKKALTWMATRLPAWVTSDMLTLLGFLGALVVATGYILSNVSPQWLWLACLGYVLNWAGDSLDGTLARVRGTQRKVYGFFIDHNVDVINETIMFLGVGCSPLMNLSFAMLALVAYFMLSIYVYIDCHLKGEMRLTYGGLGPTEFRLLMIAVNLCYLYIPWLHTWKHPVTLFHNFFMMGALDYVGIGISLVLFLFYIVGFFRDARRFSRTDPVDKQA